MRTSRAQNDRPLGPLNLDGLFLTCAQSRTTEPPRLSPSHPIRRTFQAHGTATARHWLLSILLTVIVSVLLCYPAIFQTDSTAAAGLRNVPKHVWTSTTEVAVDRPADVEVRQVWVHGDYMNAIDRRVLREALHVQNVLIGNGFGEASGAKTDQQALSAPQQTDGCLTTRPGDKWGVHSPLLYWDCSPDAIEDDKDFLATINSRSAGHSDLNLTLRPSTVFAGKVFSGKKLQSADALVITLFDQTNSSVAYAWEMRSRKLAEELSPQWTMFPENGQVLRSRFYEFRFKPMTLNDDILLAASYLFTAAYVIWRMMQLRAIKSWFGLLITIGAKMTVCVIGSFTICTFLGINLARIPRPWFPGVVFCFGLGNIFRLINVVLETPPEMPPVQRIGTAIGEVGHLSLAVAGQNLVLIWLCSRFVSPWVADFCVFAAVTLVLDFVFHLTFFLAVLSVDVQRMELQDSLERVDLTQASKSNKQERQSWLASLRHGTMPISTRFAGSAAIFSIILAINWHFFDSSGRKLTPRAMFDRIVAKRAQPPDEDLWSPPPINQARTPADWLRIQDHNTARELFGFIKPNAHSFIARVYDPLLVVLNGAEGRDTTHKPSTITEHLRNFTREHAFPAALIVVFMIAGVTLLMNYLLWTGLPDAQDEEEEEESLFSVQTLPTPQTLDIVRLASSPKGHLVSISLDRSTSLWLHERGRGYVNRILQTASMKPKLWPLVACAVDDYGNLLALCTDGGQIGLWSLGTARFLLFPTVELRGHAPILFSFTQIPSGDHDGVSIVVVTPDGYLTIVAARTGIHQTKRITSTSIVDATIYSCAKGDNSLIYVTKPGEVHILSLKEDSDWTSEVVAGLDPGPPPDSNPYKIKCIYGASSLGLIFALRAEDAEIFDFNSRALVYTLRVGHVKPHTFRVMHSARRSCACGAPAIHSLAVAYTEQDSNHMILQRYTLDGVPTSQICLGKPTDNDLHNCKGIEHAIESVHCVEPAGVWESTNSSSIVGIRRCMQSPTPSSSASGVDSGYFAAEPTALASALKLRAAKEGKANSLFASLDSAFGTRHPPASPMDTDSWEAWTLTSSGEFRCRPLISDNDDDPDLLGIEEQLFVAAPGPITRLGKRSVAVGFGNTVKIITLGKESFDGITSTSTEDGALGARIGSHKWRARRGTGRKTQ
ncbi:sterol-sensing domain of SREBP cleavage-activation-domain-containing protein [Dendryphion nanum]|uniref:Sterol regulatory element-binding protein cleavage-activating protein n=1 Tax=Dendryphion nanum TaxID=256645 RepID=A0A9P9E554_9PLEO|nr:sterol-sensing domain of SREBP cleavage-activation-domain-containing protein [Dendryphion nanum]